MVWAKLARRRDQWHRIAPPSKKPRAHDGGSIRTLELRDVARSGPGAVRHLVPSPVMTAMRWDGKLCGFEERKSALFCPKSQAR